MSIRGLLYFITGLIPMLALGWIAFPHALYREASQPLQFNHKLHTGDKVGAKCADCHALSADGRFSGVPGVSACAGCHPEPVTQSADEKKLVEEYVKPNREIPWLIYARQPENVHFPHAVHIVRARLACEQCHGAHGRTEHLRVYQENRISGYSRDIWGYSIARIPVDRPEQPSMKMDDCTGCHREKKVEAACLGCHK